MVVRVDGENIGGGKIERAQHNLEEIRQTRGLLDDVINAGMLRRRDETLFEFVETYDSRDAWDALLARHSVAGAVVDDELLNEAFRMMDEGRCTIVIDQVFRALTVERT